MRLRPILFVVTFVAGMLVIAAPPAAAADSGCGSIRGDVQDISTTPGTVLDAFFVDSNCADTFDATETAQGTSSGGGEGTATASQRYVLTFGPQGLMTSADALGSLSTSTSGAQIAANVDDNLQLRFTIPHGATGSVSAAVNAAGNGESGSAGASVSFGCEDGTDELASASVLGGTPPSANDSFSVGGVAPGECGVNVSAAAGSADGSDSSADFDVTVTVGESPCDNVPTEGPDMIIGTPDDDVLCGGDGNDIIDGAGGNDIITGGAGSDSITGGDGLDNIEGNADQDFIQGGADQDFIAGGPGDDGDENFPISGGDGNDTIEGGDGADRIEGDLGNDEISGGDDPSRDVLIGCNFDDPLCQADQAELDAAGVTDDDLIRAEAGGGADISGDAGRDILGGSPAFDAIFGGPGNDFINAAGDGDFVAGGDGKDTLEGGPGHESGNDPTTGIPLGVSGGPGNDTIRGEAGDDLLEGGVGRDEMLGNTGSDKLRGQGNNDCLIGGSRKDVLVGGGGADRLIARDGVHDVVNGGPQFDRARVDGVDDLIRVENDNFQGGCP